MPFDSVSNGCSSVRNRVSFTPTHHQYGTNRCCHSNHCANRIPVENGHGRLHKSLSFAFQTPMMWNDSYRTYHGAPRYATTSRAHSRFVLSDLIGRKIPRKILKYLSVACPDFPGVICIVNIITWLQMVCNSIHLEVEVFQKVWLMYQHNPALNVIAVVITGDHKVSDTQTALKLLSR